MMPTFGWWSIFFSIQMCTSLAGQVQELANLRVELVVGSLNCKLFRDGLDLVEGLGRVPVFLGWVAAESAIWLQHLGDPLRLIQE